MKPIILKCANLLGETGLYRILRPGRIPVFMLHRITNGKGSLPGEIPAETLRAYLTYLSERQYQVLGMEEFLAILDQDKPWPSKSVMFTIDDGFEDQNEVAARIFDEFGFPLNFFLITGLLDRELWPWDDQITYALYGTEAREAEFTLPSGKSLHVNINSASRRQTARTIRNALKVEKQESVYDWMKRELYAKLAVEFPIDIPEGFRPMSWEDARTLRARGHGVYPHTRSHRILSTLSITEKHEEIQHAQARFTQELGFTPDVFAYPTGRINDYDSDDINELRLAGFRVAFNTVPTYVQPRFPRYELPRFSLPQSESAFLQIVNRLEALKERLPAQRKVTPTVVVTR